jgi:ankyrin repeat protein
MANNYVWTPLGIQYWSWQNKYWCDACDHIDKQSHLINEIHILYKMDTYSCRSLCEAARYRHVICIQKFISTGADPNATDIFGCGWTPLRWVAHSGPDTCLKMLIAAGVNIAATDEFGRTPLHWAVDSRADRVQTLIDAGADLSATDIRGQTPLHYAACGGYDACIQALVAAGANPNITDVGGGTPLHSAVFHDHEKCVRKLIDLGATPDVYDNKVYTPLQLAAEKVAKNAQR